MLSPSLNRLKAQLSVHAARPYPIVLFLAEHRQLRTVEINQLRTDYVCAADAANQPRLGLDDFLQQMQPYVEGTRAGIGHQFFYTLHPAHHWPRGWRTRVMDGALPATLLLSIAAALAAAAQVFWGVGL